MKRKFVWWSLWLAEVWLMGMVGVAFMACGSVVVEHGGGV
jgi:hypothetical protein